MSGVSRIALAGLMGLVLAGVLALGWAWHRERTRHWDEPLCAAERFVQLSAGQRADSGGQATWMVPVNPRCRRCLATLRRLHVAWQRHARPGRLVALIVDTSQRPGAETLRDLPALPVWWDRDGLWRRRWGHRLYGELIEFDRHGRYLRTFAARDALSRLMRSAPADSSAPAMEEGT